jgi:small-conductance mechanosensitive channel
MASYFRGTLDFFARLGIYDVVLPFILVFTIVFAILEKTRIFGTEKVGEEQISKKNLNAMVAFVSAFFVVASAKLVATINLVVANSIILLLLAFLFLMLAGSFHADKEFFLEGGWRVFFMVIMFVGIVLIFLHALGWLERFFDMMKGRWDTNAVAAIILLILVVLLMWGITKRPGTASKKKEGEKNE